VEDTVIVNLILLAHQGNITVPGVNHTVSLAEKAPELLHCSGSTNLIDVLEADFLVTDLNNKIKAQADAVANQTNRLNVTSDYDEILYYINVFLNESVGLDYLQGTNISFVQQQILLINDQTTNLTRFNFSYIAYNNSLAAVNNITLDLPLKDGTVSSIYYDSDNITTLHCTQAPYNDIDQDTQQELCARASVALQLNAALQDIITIQSTTSDILERLEGFTGAYNRIHHVQDDIASTMATVQNGASESYNSTVLIMTNAIAIVDVIVGIVYNGTTSLETDTQCAYLGNVYSSLSNTLCKQITPAAQITAAMMLLGAITMFFGAIVSFKSLTRFG